MFLVIHALKFDNAGNAFGFNKALVNWNQISTILPAEDIQWPNGRAPEAAGCVIDIAGDSGRLIGIETMDELLNVVIGDSVEGVEQRALQFFPKA